MTQAAKPRVLISDPIAQEGVDLLSEYAEVEVRPGLTKDELKAALAEYDGLIVRSETKVTADVIQAGTRLQVIGRAGVGVDNIDLDAATLQGIAVVNAPTGNTIAAAEHTMALMLALARHVPQANATMRAGEWKRSTFIGVEMRGKTLGIIGLGRVGSEVARRAAGFSMSLLGYDPFVSADYAQHLGVELASLEELLRRSDFITVHTPITDSTKGLIGVDELGITKPGVRLINVARGGLVNEDALLQALESGHVAGAALDVFDKEPPGESPLVQHPKVVTTPHLGASTEEAQQEVAREVAQEVIAILEGRPAKSTVNLPFMPSDVQDVVAPYLEIATTLGKVATQLAEGQFVSLSIKYSGELANHSTSMLKAAALVGVLGAVSEERLNLVNAGVIAAQRGLRILEEKDTSSEDYPSMITLEIHTQEGIVSLAGTRIQDETHIVRANGQTLDVVPSSPYLLFIEHQDRPGMIGALGMLTGSHDINIAFMAVGRQAPRGHAIMVVGLDDPVPEAVMDEICAIPHIDRARLARL